MGSACEMSWIQRRTPQTQKASPALASSEWRWAAKASLAARPNLHRGPSWVHPMLLPQPLHLQRVVLSVLASPCSGFLRLRRESINLWLGDRHPLRHPHLLDIHGGQENSDENCAEGHRSDPGQIERPVQGVKVAETGLDWRPPAGVRNKSELDVLMEEVTTAPTSPVVIRSMFATGSPPTLPSSALLWIQRDDRTVPTAETCTGLHVRLGGRVESSGRYC